MPKQKRDRRDRGVRWKAIQAGETVSYGGRVGTVVMRGRAKVLITAIGEEKLSGSALVTRVGGVIPTSTSPRKSPTPVHVDPNRERMHIDDIIAGLNDIETMVFGPFEISADNVGLLALKASCEAFRQAMSSDLPVFFNGPTSIDMLVYVASAMDFVRYFGFLRHKSTVKLCAKHLRLAGRGYISVAATRVLPRPGSSGLQDLLVQLKCPMVTPELRLDASRKTIETIVGLSCLQFCDAVELEDPDESGTKPKNPDIIAVFKGERYGIACKSITGNSLQAVRQNATKAAEQIAECYRQGTISPWKGLILLDVSSLLDHQTLLHQPIESYSDAFMYHFDQALKTAYEGETRHEVVYGGILAGQGIAPQVLLYAHGLVVVHDGDHQRPTLVKNLINAAWGDCSMTNLFVQRLHRALHCQTADP